MLAILVEAAAVAAATGSAVARAKDNAPPTVPARTKRSTAEREEVGRGNVATLRLGEMRVRRTVMVPTRQLLPLSLPFET